MRRLLIAFRILLLVLAASAVTVAVWTSAGGTSTPDSQRYVCPMHPEVRAAEPGQCPICRMALEPVGGNSGAAHHEMTGMADVTAVENVRKHKIIDFVRMRSLLFDVRELRGPAWVESDHTVTAVFYNDQIKVLDAAESGSFSLTQAPKITFAVRRTSDPVIPWDRSTSRIHFLQSDVGRATKAAPQLQPGKVGWLTIAPKSREVLGVPASAVLQSPEGPYVLASLGGGRFEKRSIEIGETFLKQGFAVVLSGLSVHERVVSRATFFLDADRRSDSHAGEGGWIAP